MSAEPTNATHSQNSVGPRALKYSDDLPDSKPKRSPKRIKLTFEVPSAMYVAFQELCEERGLSSSVTGQQMLGYYLRRNGIVWWENMLDIGLRELKRDNDSD